MLGIESLFVQLPRYKERPPMLDDEAVKKLEKLAYERGKRETKAILSAEYEAKLESARERAYRKGYREAEKAVRDKAFKEGRKFAEKQLKAHYEREKTIAFSKGADAGESETKKVLKSRYLPAYEADEKIAYHAKIDFVEDNFTQRIQTLKPGQQLCYALRNGLGFRGTSAAHKRHSIALRFHERNEVVLFVRPIQSVEINDEAREGRFETQYEYCLRKL
ncbi:MAG: hypothetical protein ABQ298_02390 [Puniceicoccaceae bacterium]